MAAKGWHRSDIKSALEKAGWTLSALDRQHDLPDGTISAAIRIPHLKGEEVIAQALGVPAVKIWPKRYLPDGSRRRPQPPENYKPAPSARASQKRKAARTPKRRAMNTPGMRADGR